MSNANGDVATFWEHLEQLRTTLIGIVIAVFAAMVVAFALKGPIFDIILAPHHSDFITYKLLGAEDFNIRLMNVGLTEQFLVHVKVSFFIGLLAVMPYVLYALFHFISPGLYDNERRLAIAIVSSGYVMFIIGALLCYFLVFPLTVRFLGTYQVSEDVVNMLTIDSYIDTLLVLVIMIGLVFELPVVCWLLARIHLLSSGMMSLYRRHAIVAILVVAAIVTPTTDPFTLFAVSLPVWLLYETSVWIVKITNK